MKIFKYTIIFLHSIAIFPMEPKKLIWTEDEKKVLVRFLALEDWLITRKMQPCLKKSFDRNLQNEIEGNSNPLLLAYLQQGIQKEVKMDLETPGSSMLLLPLRQEYETKMKKQKDDFEKELQQMRDQAAELLNLNQKYVEFRQEVQIDKMNYENENPSATEFIPSEQEKKAVINLNNEWNSRFNNQVQKSNVKMVGALFGGIAIGYSIKLICDKLH